MKRVKEDYENAIKNSKSIAETCRNLGLKCAGGNYKTIKYFIKKYNIDTSHFTGQGWNVGLKFKPNKGLTLEEVLVKNSNYTSFKLKNKLLKEGVKEKRCECCKRTEWNGNLIPLELHHINGDNTDNRLENLQILCPNCHAQTDYYRGRNIKKNKECISKENVEKENIKKQESKRFCQTCGPELNSKQKTFCSQKCSHKPTTKRPTEDELKEIIKKYKNNKCAIGRHFNVSDSAVRKWMKTYKIGSGEWRNW